MFAGASVFCLVVFQVNSFEAQVSVLDNDDITGNRSLFQIKR